MRDSAFATYEKLRKGEASSQQITEEYLGRIERVEERVRAFVTQTPGEARAAAAEVDARLGRGEELSPVAGVPMAAKMSVP